MPIYRVIYKNAQGEREALIDRAKDVNELCSRHRHMEGALPLACEEELRYAHYELVALFHNIINIASIGIRLTDRWEEFTEDELSEVATLISVLEEYTERAKDYLSVLEGRRNA